MKFIEATDLNALATDVERNLEIIYDHEKQATAKNLTVVVDELTQAANALDLIGYTKEASVITSILVSLADAATSNLTPEKMVENLKEKGWVFNAEDGQELENYLSPEELKEPEERVVEEDLSANKNTEWSQFT